MPSTSESFIESSNTSSSESPKPKASQKPLSKTILQDILAAISVALILIPQSLAYAELAGMPAHYGIYVAAVPPIAAAFFASSPYLQTGPTALTGILSFGALTGLVLANGNSLEPASQPYIAAAALLALLVGLWRVIIGVLKLGRIAYFMSQPVLRGFTTAAALIITASQLPATLGITPPSGTILYKLGYTLTNLGSLNIVAIGFSLLTAALMIGGRRISPLFPSIFIAVIITTYLSHLFGYSNQFANATVGNIDVSGFKFSLALPWQYLPKLLVSSLVIAVVGFAEATSIARAFASETRTRWYANQEFISQGAANIAASVVSGFPVGGSFGRSALAKTTGAQTRWSGAITGGIVLAVMPLMQYLTDLPKSVLSAIVIVAVSKLIRFSNLTNLWQLSKAQFCTAWLTFFATLLLSPRIDYAVLIGISASLLIHLYRQMQLQVFPLADISALDATKENNEAITVAVLGVLWFASTEILEDALTNIMSKYQHVNKITIDCSGVGHVDLSGAMALSEIMSEARAQEFVIDVIGLSPRVVNMLDTLQNKAQAQKQ